MEINLINKAKKTNFVLPSGTDPSQKLKLKQQQQQQEQKNKQKKVIVGKALNCVHIGYFWENCGKYT